MTLTLGVEEELQLLDGDTLLLASRADEVAASAPDRILTELPMSQVEVVTGVCDTLDEVRRQVSANRALASAAAVSAGLRIASCATPPLGDWRTNRPRTDGPYGEMAGRSGHLVREQLIAGLHVHVGIEEPERAVGVIDRLRADLPVLLALSASSPFWSGADSGYSSFRAVHWRRWPVSGPPPHFGSLAAYQGHVDRLVGSGLISGERAVYWDVRRSARFPTVEVRVCDAVQTVDEVVALVGLIRGLVAAALDAHDRGAPLDVQSPEQLSLATWAAARNGVAGDLLDGSGSPVPAAELVRPLLDRAGPWLSGDDGQILPVVERLLAGGAGAQRQRAAGDPRAAAELVVAETMAGVERMTLPRVAPAGRLDPDEERLAAERPPHH